MNSVKKVSDYIRALYTAGLDYPAWSEDRAQYHTEAMWLFCTQLFPKQFPYKPFHREWMYVANRYQYFCILAPRSHAKCQTLCQPIPTPSGRVVTAGELKPGDKVFGRDKNTIVEKTVLATERVGKKESITITLVGGREITTSKEHRHLTWSGWIEAEKLSEGDWIAVPRRLPEATGAETNKDCEFVLAGYLIGDGSVGIEKSNGIQRAAFSNINPHLVSDFTKCAEEMGWAVIQRTNNDYYLADNKTGTRTAWLQEWGMAGKLSGDKRIPEQVMMASNRQVALFLSRLYACDGHATLAGGGAIGYCSKNKDMIVDLQGLLLRFGINSAISPTVSRKYGGTYWRLQINGTDIILFADQIGIFGKEDDVAAVRQAMAERELSDKEYIRQLPPEWRKDLMHSPHWFRENYGIRIDTAKYATGYKKVRLVAEIENNQKLLDAISGDIAWLPIRSIVSGPSVEMVDIQVDGDSSFVAANILTHNSSIIGGLYPLFRIVMNPSSTVMLVASSSSVSELQLRSIREHIETHQGIKEGFSDLYPENPSKWTNTEIIVQRPPGLPHPTVVALGAGNAILSRRAQFIIADDIVRDDETRTAEQRRKLADWVNGVLIGVLEADDQFGVIGTRKHYADFYSELEGNSIYHHRVYDSIQKELSDGTWVTIWPEKWPENKLKERRQALGTFQFNQNYRNIVLSEDDSPFPIVWLESCKDRNLTLQNDYPYNDLRKVIGVDLAGGKTDDTSYFVATVMGMREDGHFIVLNMIRDRMDFPEQVRTIEDLIDRFSPGLDAVIVESNAYQSAMTATIQAKFPALNVVAHQTGRNKHSQEEGIPMLQPIIEGRRLHLPYRDTRAQTMMDVVIEEFNRYGVARHSDTVMSIWFCVKYLAPLNRYALTRGRAMIL